MATYHIFNIGRPPSTEWWLQNLTRGVITAGFDGRPDDRGEVILRAMDEHDWIIAYANRRGFVGAGRVLGMDTYRLHEDLPSGSLSDHRHERAVQWLYAVDDVANAVTLDEAGRQQPRQTKEREANHKTAECIIGLLRERACFRRAPTPMQQALQSVEQQVVADSFPTIDSEHDARIWALGLMVQRRGQPEFRTSLLAAYAGRCAVTGCSAVDVLEAAHIIPYRGAHTNRIDNGLLLRADIHTLYDLGRIWVDPDSMTIQMDAELLGSEYATFHGQPLRLPQHATHHPNRQHLALHMQQATGASVYAEALKHSNTIAQKPG